MAELMTKNYQFTCTAPFFIKPDSSGEIRVTGIFCDGNVLFSAAKYLALQRIAKGHRKSWEAQFVQAIRLLIEYTSANKRVFNDANEMFKMFAYRLQFGTIDRDGKDPSGLLWEQRTQKNAQRIITYITDYSDWLYKESGGQTKILNLIRKATTNEKILNLAAYNNRINNSFLGHTYSDNHKEDNTESVREVRAAKTAQENQEAETVYKFPENKFADLITLGFRKKTAVKGGSIDQNYRIDYMLITMLMHLGGLRVSEPFHIYVDDIIPFEARIEIKVYHPTLGLAPVRARRKYKNQVMRRKEFLMKEYGLLDRKSDTETGFYAGWKNSTVDPKTNAFPVLTFGDSASVNFMYSLFRIYMQIRVEPLKGREHPFLFTDQNGDPLHLKTFTQAHQRAVRKIGITPLLEYGGTPHCHRHSYGQRLADCKVDPLDIKYCMHHASIDSQDAYTQPQMNKIRHSLTTGLNQLDESQVIDANNFLEL
jgi:hypothetical protein